MLKLETMTEAEYSDFMEISIKDHIAKQIEAGFWPHDEAEAKMLAMRQQVIPQERDTPNHYFYSIKDSDQADTVGGFWFAVMQKEGKQFIIVFDIQVYEAFRRKGYGSQAFSLMEDHARELGVGTIMLYVHPQNHAARAMYLKLGYQGSETELTKAID